MTQLEEHAPQLLSQNKMELLDVLSSPRKRAESEVSRYYDAQDDTAATNGGNPDFVNQVDSLTLSNDVPDSSPGHRQNSQDGEIVRRSSNSASTNTNRPLHHRKTSSTGSTVPKPVSTSMRQQIAQELRKSTASPVDSTSVAAEHLSNSIPPFSAADSLARPDMPGRSRSFSRTRSLSYLKRMEPELPDFMVSAPAKVIMYGEHAVVHGKAAIAAALSLRSYLHVHHLPRNKRTVTLQFADVNLNHTWDIESLPWEAFNTPEKKRMHFDTVSSLDEDLLEAMSPHLASITNRVNHSAATAFLYVYLCLGSKHSPASIFTLRSTIPIGAGLGSSASISVSLSAALHLQAGMLVRPSAKLFEEEYTRQLKRINDWAFVAEMCIHGNPSGVDNTVATGGKAVLFRRGDYSKPPEVKRLEYFPELPLMLVNTNQPRRTAELVSDVHSLRNSHPTTCSLMLDAIDNVTAEALMLLDNKHFRPDDSHLTRLGELTRINHGLLVSLGVSHPKLERVRQIVDGSGIGWTKLTGAGGGGCSFSILKPNTKESLKEKVDKQLVDEGFVTYETTLGGDGVGVLWPAQAGRGDERWDITREMFLEAEGSEGLEGLVGVKTLGTGRLGWGFWREWLPEEA